MSSVPSAITADNFHKIWRYTARKQYWSKKKAAIRSISVPLGQLLYFFVFVVFAYGAACSMIPGMVHRYIQEIPDLVSLWTDFEAAFFASATTEGQRMVRTAAALYLAPFAAAAVPALLVILLYHPRMPKQTGNPAQDARELWITAKHAQVYAQRKESNTVNICAAFAGMLIAVAVLGYLLYGLTNPSLRQQVIAEAHTANLRLFLYALALFFSYKILNLPLYFLLKLLHYCYIPKNLVPVTEEYYRSLQTSSAESETSDK